MADNPIVGIHEDDRSDGERNLALSTVSAIYLARLSEIATSRDKRIHAVLDGARFASLGADLSSAGICHRPLYRQDLRQQDVSHNVVVGGPWFACLSSMPPQPASANFASLDGDLSDGELAALSERLVAEMAESIASGDESGGRMLPSDGIDKPDEVEQRIEALLKLVGDQPGVVFWICNRTVSDDEMFRHLRSINRVLMPQDWATSADQKIVDNQNESNFGEIASAAGAQDEAKPAAQDAERGSERLEAVVFRHADPNVMLQVFPLLSPEQAARLIGPAEQVFFAPGPMWGGGIKRARRPVGVVPPKGMLRINTEQMAELHAVRAQSSQRKIAGYLRTVAPQQTAGISDQDLDVFVTRSYRSGTKLGLRAERGQGYWAYLLLYSGGRMGRDPATRDMLLNHPELGTPDQKIYLLMQRLSSLPGRH
ncbi:hypothetical protein [Agrobacterium rosae]|uniref:hypothetical protein n=1 Tax=Agrobacterium rosae TaxID=1972867 RepID=UPI003A80B5A6